MIPVDPEEEFIENVDKEYMGLTFEPRNYQFGFHGGIIADETGLGKTLEAIAFIKQRRGKTEPVFNLDKEQFVTGATLIICPKYPFFVSFRCDLVALLAQLLTIFSRSCSS